MSETSKIAKLVVKSVTTGEELSGTFVRRVSGEAGTVLVPATFVTTAPGPVLSVTVMRFINALPPWAMPSKEEQISFKRLWPKFSLNLLVGMTSPDLLISAPDYSMTFILPRAYIIDETEALLILDPIAIQRFRNITCHCSQCLGPHRAPFISSRGMDLREDLDRNVTTPTSVPRFDISYGSQIYQEDKSSPNFSVEDARGKGRFLSSVGVADLGNSICSMNSVTPDLHVAYVNSDSSCIPSNTQGRLAVACGVYDDTVGRGVYEDAMGSYDKGHSLLENTERAGEHLMSQEPALKVFSNRCKRCRSSFHQMQDCTYQRKNGKKSKKRLATLVNVISS